MPRLAPKSISGQEAQPGEPSLNELSRLTGLSLGHLSRIANGRVYPSWRAARLICVALGISLCDLDELLGEGEQEEQHDNTGAL